MHTRRTHVCYPGSNALRVSGLAYTRTHSHSLLLEFTSSSICPCHLTAVCVRVPLRLVPVSPCRLPGCAFCSFQVTAFLQANDRLQLPPHPSFIGWQRSRSATSKARDEMKRARQQVGASLPQITRSPPCARVRATLGPNAFSDACTHHH
eukprot:6214757-Pleurochrysis_carterae.AAC.3